jgi:hypothetical protein
MIILNLKTLSLQPPHELAASCQPIKQQKYYNSSLPMFKFLKKNFNFVQTGHSYLFDVCHVAEH